MLSKGVSRPRATAEAGQCARSLDVARLEHLVREEARQCSAVAVEQPSEAVSRRIERFAIKQYRCCGRAGLPWWTGDPSGVLVASLRRFTLLSKDGFRLARARENESIACRRGQRGSGGTYKRSGRQCGGELNSHGIRALTSQLSLRLMLGALSNFAGPFPKAEKQRPHRRHLTSLRWAPDQPHPYCGYPSYAAIHF